MTGRLSDRPMIRAASIPHLGQTTPTAALGLRAIRSLLTRLDANRLPTVLIGLPVSGFASLPASKLSIFPINPETMQKPAPGCPLVQSAVHLCITTLGQPTFPSPFDWSFSRPVHTLRHVCRSSLLHQRDCRNLATGVYARRRANRKNRPEIVQTERPPRVVCALLLNGSRGFYMSPNIDLLTSVRREFIEMPGLRLRIDQAQRLWNLDRALCESVLRALVDAKFLGQSQNDLYARL